MPSNVQDFQINAVPAAHVLYVNQVEGPFTTLAAAKAAAQSGDTIVVGPGTYIENDLLKNGVNWFFAPGAIVTFTSPALQANSNDILYGIFDDRSSGPVECTIGGHGSFSVYSRGHLNLLGTFVVTNANSKISFAGKEIAFATYHDRAPGVGSRAAVYVKNTVRVDVNCDRIYGARGTSYDTGLIDDVGDPIYWSEYGSGVYWELGDLYVHCGSIEKISGYGAWGNQPPGNTTAANFWLNADFIENHLYMDGGTDAAGHVGTYNWRSWIVAKEILEGVAYFDSGRHYLTVQKIDLQRALMSFNGATQVWMTAQKITNTLAGGWMLLQAGNGGSPILHADVAQFEDNQGVFNIAGILIADASEVHLRGSYLKAGSGPAVLHVGGKARIQGITIDTSTTNKPNNHAIKVAGSGLVLNNCILFAPALADSINAAAPQTVTCYGVRANRAKHANVSVNVDPLTVDPKVV
jgi:hypothetical protein